MMTSAKQEVHNIFHCHQRRTEPQPQVTRTEYSLKFGRFVVEMFEQTDILTRLSQYFASLPWTK